jgi:hypothetical protein
MDLGLITPVPCRNWIYRVQHQPDVCVRRGVPDDGTHRLQGPEPSRSRWGVTVRAPRNSSLLAFCAQKAPVHERWPDHLYAI